jgi:thioredoxin
MSKMTEEEEIQAIRAKKEKKILEKIANPIENEMPTEIVHLNTADEFNSLVEKYQDKVIVIDFWAEWCAPCKMFGPIFEAAQKEWSSEYIFAKLDTERLPNIAQALDVMGIPMLLFIKGKTEVHRQSGALRKNQFNSLLQQVKIALEKRGEEKGNMYS